MHTAFGPSSLSKRRFCPGSFHQEMMAERIETRASSRGTGLHEIMEDLIRGKEVVVPDGDREAIECALRYLDSALAGDEILPGGEETRNGGKVFIEVRFDHLAYSQTSNECGTCDLVIVYDDHILLVDWKFGGSYVDHPKWNLQMKGYAIGVWDRFGRKPIHVAIIQPAVSPDYQLSPWIYGVEQYDEFRVELGAIVENCLVPEARRVVGKSCVFCNARKTCPSRVAIYSVYGEGYSMREAYKAATPDQRSILLTHAKIAIDVANDLIDFIRDDIKETGEVPVGYTAKVTVTGRIQINPTPLITSWSPDGAPDAPLEITDDKFPEVSKWKI